MIKAYRRLYARTEMRLRNQTVRRAYLVRSPKWIPAPPPEEAKTVRAESTLSAASATDYSD